MALPHTPQPCRPCEVGTIAIDGLVCSECVEPYTTTREGSVQCDGCTKDYYRDPTITHETKCISCPENAYCAGDTLLPVPRAGYWSNRSDLALVHHIHACPRDGVCIGGLGNKSDADQKVVTFKECWLPDNLTSDGCPNDEILW